jgi:hypothetical protein
MIITQVWYLILNKYSWVDVLVLVLEDCDCKNNQVVSGTVKESKFTVNELGRHVNIVGGR